MDLFKISPELMMTFEFLQHYDIGDEAFHQLLSKHALRVLTIVTLIVKEVSNI